MTITEVYWLIIGTWSRDGLDADAASTGQKNETGIECRGIEERKINNAGLKTREQNEEKQKNFMSNYPLYDVPYLVREPNDTYMSLIRYKIEVYNQAIVDDYFIERDRGTSALMAQKMVTIKNGIPIMRVEYCLRWYYQEAVRRGKYSFLQKFPPPKEHIVQY